MLGLPSRDGLDESKTAIISDQAPTKRIIEAQGNGSVSAHVHVYFRED